MIVASLRVLFSSCSPGPHWLGADMYPHVFAASKVEGAGVRFWGSGFFYFYSTSGF